MYILRSDGRDCYVYFLSATTEKVKCNWISFVMDVCHWVSWLYDCNLSCRIFLQLFHSYYEYSFISKNVAACVVPKDSCVACGNRLFYKNWTRPHRETVTYIILLPYLDEQSWSGFYKAYGSVFISRRSANVCFTQSIGIINVQANN